jgi:hypothetical protein
MTDRVGVDAILAELRACPPEDLPGVRASFAAVAADPDAVDAWRAFAGAAVVAIDRMAGGVDPAVTLGAFEPDLMAAHEAGLAGHDRLAATRSRARRRRRGPP